MSQLSSISYSILIHLLLLSFLIIPMKGGRKGVPVFVKLISVEEISETTLSAEDPMTEILQFEQSETLQDSSFPFWKREQPPLNPPLQRGNKGDFESNEFIKSPLPLSVASRIDFAKEGYLRDDEAKEKHFQGELTFKSVKPDESAIPPGTGFSFGRGIEHPPSKANLFEKSEKSGEVQSGFSESSEGDEYLFNLKQEIEGLWKYPLDAALRGISGDLLVEITIKRNGELGDVRIARTSGNKSLDDAVIETIKEAAPYSPLPASWRSKSMTITGHFVYKKR